ncbi:MAG: hypothetical protein HY015_07805 [Bacteroidetes bacterium]|nr:hypothetical protein [Bacteroidota bacterium]MBI3482863.1 hypothetical protein [Bacteroidota bacterium]
MNRLNIFLLSIAASAGASIFITSVISLVQISDVAKIKTALHVFYKAYLNHYGALLLCLFLVAFILSLITFNYFLIRKARYLKEY